MVKFSPRTASRVARRRRVAKAHVLECQGGEVRVGGGGVLDGVLGQVHDRDVVAAMREKLAHARVARRDIDHRIGEEQRRRQVHEEALDRDLAVIEGIGEVDVEGPVAQDRDGALGQAIAQLDALDFAAQCRAMRRTAAIPALEPARQVEEADVLALP